MLAAFHHCLDRCGEGLPGRLILCGVGKAGHIGRKLAATFASTGTPAFFVHPTEAHHGDLGMIGEQDIVLLLSNSGSSNEVVDLLPSLRRIGCLLAAVVGKTDSPLGEHADLCLSIGRVAEACPLGLAPSASTTALLALGDAIALTVQAGRNFTPEQYARYHPGGALGRKLMTCGEAMRGGDRLATVAPTTSVRDTLHAISLARAGCALLVDEERRLLGIFTDGDLRRALDSTTDPAATLNGPVSTVAALPCRRVSGSELLHSAIHTCAEHHIDELPVVDDNDHLIGLIDLQDLAARGFEL
ncbi:MAG: KpsF/GutQ family sugar-phosphate isomerase [Planctomycetota bacterium]|jgi:arabinose-5-phosphate isomerase